MHTKACWRVIIIAAVAGLLVLPVGAQENQEEAKRFYRIGLAALEENDLKIASSNLAKAAALAPTNALIKYNLGIVLSMANDNEGARSNLESAIKLGLDAKAKDAAENLLAKVTYKLEKASSLASQIKETWKDQVEQRTTSQNPRGEILKYEYVVSSVVVNACTVTVSTRRTEFKKGRNDKWVPTGESGLSVDSVPMDTVTRVRKHAPINNFIQFVTSNKSFTYTSPSGVVTRGDAGYVPTGSGTEKLTELLTDFAKACNAPLLP